MEEERCFPPVNKTSKVFTSLINYSVENNVQPDLAETLSFNHRYPSQNGECKSASEKKNIEICRHLSMEEKKEEACRQMRLFLVR